MTKVTSVSTSKPGKIDASPQHDGPSPLELCQDKWEHLREDVKGKMWSECPPEMVGDFMRAMAQYFVHNFHDDAVMKTLQYVASTVFKDPNATGFELSATYLGSRASAMLSVKLSPEDKFEREMAEEPTVAFEISTAADNEEDVRAALGQWAEEDEPQTRIIFDPIASLPNSDIVALVKHIEHSIGKEDLLVMSTSALTLLLWQKCEKTNAQTAELTIRGLYEGKNKIRAGEKIVAFMKVEHLDSDLSAQISDNENVYSITSKIGKMKG